MKNLFVIIALAMVALFSSCKKEKINNSSVWFQDYIFTVLSGPDKDGDIKIEIKNINKIGFDYLEFEDDEAIKRWSYGHAIQISDSVQTFDSVRYPYKRVVIINKENGIMITQAPFTSVPLFIKVFESASSFFDIN